MGNGNGSGLGEASWGMEKELGRGKGPGNCIALLLLPTARLQHPGRKSLTVGNLHLQGVSVLVPFPDPACAVGAARLCREALPASHPLSTP